MVIVVPGWTSNQSCSPLIAIILSLPSIARSYIPSCIYSRWSRASRVSFLKRSLIASANIYSLLDKNEGRLTSLILSGRQTSYDPASSIGISYLLPIASIRTTPVNIGRCDIEAERIICCCSIEIAMYMTVKAWFPSAHAAVDLESQNGSPKTFANSIQYPLSIAWLCAWR